MQQYTFEKYSQEEIIQGIKNNDSKVIQVFYQSQYKKIEQYVLANNGYTEDAKDIYQEAFIVLWKNIRKGKFIPENRTAIAGYIYQIAKNKTTVELQSNLRQSEEDNELETEEYHQWVVKEFENLGQTCKEVLKRFYFQKESMEQIAMAFEWTPATARNNKYRCIKQLKDKWKTKTKKDFE